MRNRMYGGVRGRKTKVGRKLLRFPPTRFYLIGFDGLQHLYYKTIRSCARHEQEYKDMTKSVYVCDQDADVAIKTMMAAVVGTAVIPAHVNWALTASAMGAGAVAIGKCYGVQLTKDEGWKFVKQFVLSAGMWFLSMNVGSKILSMLMESTGFGYAVGAALDAATSAAFVWAIGSTAKAYFRNEYLGKSKLTKEELGEIFRKAFRDQKNK